MEITCPEPAYSDILPNATLANLYESNGKAVGMQFPEQPAKFHGIFIKKDKKNIIYSTEYELLSQSFLGLCRGDVKSTESVTAEL